MTTIQLAKAQGDHSPALLRLGNHHIVSVRAITRTDVEGEIEGYINLWGNPECVEWRPDIRVGWGDSVVNYGIVADVLGDDLLIDRYELHWDWVATGETITLPKLSVRAVDSYGTWFDRTRPPYMALENGMERRPFMYQHGQDEVIGKTVLGTIVEILFDDIGIKFRAMLDRACPFFDKTVGEIQRGELFTSSSTAEHTGEFYPDGAMKTWILHELSATPNPAEERMPAVSIIRSDAPMERDASSDLTDEQKPITAEPPPAVETPAPSESETNDETRTDLMDMQQAVAAIAAALNAGASPQDILNALVSANVTPEQLQQLADAIAAMSGQAEQSVPEPVEGGEQTQMSAPPNGQRSAQQALNSLAALLRNGTQQQTAIERAVDAEVRRRMSAAPVPQATERTAPNVGANVNLIETRRYAGHSPEAMWGVAAIIRNMQEHGVKIELSDAFKRSMAHKTHAMRNRLLQQDEFMESYLAGFTRADDFMSSESTGQGDEWVGVLYGNRIWNKARVRTIYKELIARGIMEMEVPAGAESVKVPLEGADPIFYTTQQASNKDATGNPEVVVNYNFVGSASVDITPGEVTGAVAYTDTLTEDAVFNVVAQLTSQLETKAGEVIEAIMINADTRTAASTNINLVDGTPGSGLNKPHYLVTNGFLYLPLVTNTLMGSDASAVLELATFTDLKTLMSDELIADPEKLLYLTDVKTYQAAKGMPQILTNDVTEEYTLRTGRLPKIDGTDVFQSGQMALANSAGKIPVAGGTLGRILLLYPEYWALVWKRMITFETGRFMLSKTNVITAAFRLAMQARSNNAAALAYNVALTAS